MNPPTALDVTVVIPCLNEEETIGKCVDDALAVLREPGLSGEVVVVDNGSSDASVLNAQTHGARVIVESKKGYGNALIRGFTEAKGGHIVFADADQSYDFRYIPQFVCELKKGNDLVIGSRMCGKIEKGAMPFLHRHVGTPVLTSIVRLFFKVRITDINCGMRGITKPAVGKLQLSCGGMELASEMIMKAASLGLRITEVPIDFKKDMRGRRPHLKMFLDGWRHLRLILLFAPKWLFLIPGLLSFTIGFGVMILILLNTFRYFGIFSMLVCQSLIFLGAQCILYGVSSCGFSQFMMYNRKEDVIFRLFRSFTIEKGILVGVVIFAIGLVISVTAGIDIYQFMLTTPDSIFKADSTKWGFFGMTLAILGFQTVFSSFYLCLFNIRTIQE